MKKAYLLLSLIIVLLSYLIACKKSNNNTSDNISRAVVANTCDSSALINDPLSVFWIQRVIAGDDCPLYRGASLTTCIYQGRLVVYLQNFASSLGICTTTLYSCKGEVLLRGLYADYADSQNQYSNKKTFWTK